MNTHTNQKADRQSRPIPLSVLVNRGRMIFFDATAINAAGFNKLLMQAFPDLKGKKETCLFIPSFAAAAIAEDKKANVSTLIRYKMAAVLNVPSVRDYEGFLPLIAGRSREKGDFCFLVNDPVRARSILAASKAAGIFVQIFMITDEGQLTGIDFRRKETGRGSGPDKILPDAFALCDRPERMQVRPYRSAGLLGPGSVVYTEDGQAVRLMEKEVANVNGTTYRTASSLGWAKIYAPQFMNSFMEAKIRRMLSKPVSWPGLCWPRGILRDGAGTFVGILTAPSRGVPLHTTIFRSSGLEQAFPGWDRKDLTDLTITILKAFQYLHRMNILMGCVNPASIRIVSPGEIFLLDTDNYQIEGFPCLVYNVSFTPPELQGRRIYLCTKDNEDYAVAMLVFMLMMQGKTPYTIDRKTPAAKALVDRNFPFSAGNLKGSGVRNAAMPGTWRFMWSHLTPFKEPFYHTFQKGARYERPQDRLRASDWLRTSERFRESLERPSDPESLRIRPRTFKRSKEEPFYRCEICGVEHPRFYFDRTYFDEHKVCNGCMGKKSDKSFTCRSCGRTFYYTNRTRFFHERKKREDADWKDQKYCRDCKRKTEACVDCGREFPFYRLRNGCCPDCGREPWKTKRCRSCGRTFTLTRADYHATVGQGKYEPERCPDCRKMRRGGGGFRF